MGASVHVTNTSGTLSNLHPYNGNDQLYIGDGQPLILTHMGAHQNQTPSGNLNLKDVLLVPSLKKNLISVSRLTKNNNFSIEFTSSDM